MAKKTPRRPARTVTAKQVAEPGSHLLDDGTLTVKLKSGEHAGKTFHIDLWAAKVATEAVERKHNVGEKNFAVTATLLVDLATAYKALPGIDYCTPTMAYQLWSLITKEFLDLKNGMGSTLN